MKRALITAAVLALTTGGAAMAQSGGFNINERQAVLDSRIDAGIRTGQLSRGEADRLRAEFRAIADLEARYRASAGLDPRERAELDARFDRLTAGIRDERGDVNWVGINNRQGEINARIDAGVRNGQLTRVEAERLRAEFRDIAQLEARFRATGGGLDQTERRELSRRFDDLQARVNRQRTDAQGPANGADRNGSFNQRQVWLNQRIDAGLRNGRLTRPEANRLRTEFDAVARLEASYRASGRGIDPRERADLNRRFDEMVRRFRLESIDRQQR
jgi:hypothetical protein